MAVSSLVGLDDAAGPWLGLGVRGELEGDRLGGWISLRGAARVTARSPQQAGGTRQAELELLAGPLLRVQLGPASLRTRIGAGVAVIRNARAGADGTCTTPSCPLDTALVSDAFRAYAPRPRLALGLGLGLGLAASLELRVALEATADPLGAASGEVPDYAVGTDAADALALSDAAWLQARASVGLAWRLR